MCKNIKTASIRQDDLEKIEEMTKESVNILISRIQNDDAPSQFIAIGALLAASIRQLTVISAASALTEANPENWNPEIGTSEGFKLFDNIMDNISPDIRVKIKFPKI